MEPDMSKNNKKRNKRKSKALILSQISLAPAQSLAVHAITPAEFIKKRQARGGQVVPYVEGGYITARLNQVFGPLNWNFQVVRETIQDKAVSVYGELTVLDHKNNWRVTKGQYGSHERHDNIPIGDTLKAASTDSLKKCASLFGFALDVYWPELDRAGEKPDNKFVKQETKHNADELFETAKKMISAQKDIDILTEFIKRIKASKIHNEARRQTLINLANGQIDRIANS